MNLTTTDRPIHFLGGGNMASAIIHGLAHSNPHLTLTICDPSADVRERHEGQGRTTYPSIAQCQGADCIVLAVKPQYYPGAIEDLRRSVKPDVLMISVMAGISTETIESSFPTARVIRAMPNTPMAVSQGMVGITKGRNATDIDLEFAAQIFSSSGKVLRVSETQMNAITAVSGSGPAYFFRFCEVMLKAAQEVGGFTAEEAELLVQQTAQGAMAYLAAQDGFPVAQLRREVTSPGGTTEAALKVFQEDGLETMMNRALKAAILRGQELDSQSV